MAKNYQISCLKTVDVLFIHQKYFFFIKHIEGLQKLHFRLFTLRSDHFYVPQKPKCVKKGNKIGAFTHLFDQILVIRANQTDPKAMKIV